MKRLAQLSLLILALVFHFAENCAAGEVPQLTADMAYVHVQTLRQSANRLLKKNPSDVDLKNAISTLREALSYLDQRAVSDLAVGHEGLYYRGLDARVDLAALYVRTSQFDEALNTLEQFNNRYWYAGLPGYLADKKILAPLENEPRMQALLKRWSIPVALYDSKVLASAYKPTLTSAERAAGVSMFWHQVRADFAFFDNVPDLDWGQTYLNFLERVEATSSTEDYYRVLMQLAPLLKDGHTDISPPDELSKKFYARPPLRTELIEDRVLVTSVDSVKLSALVNVGDEIVDIDGIPVRRYVEKYVDPFVSSSTPQDRKVRQYTYQLLHGDENKAVRLSLKGRTGATREVSLQRKGYDDVVAHPTFEFRLLPGDLAYISIEHFESDAGVKAFERALPTILKARGLIIDVRNNGGGDSIFGVRLLRFLTNEPIPGPISYSRADNGLSRNDQRVIEWKPTPYSGASNTGTRPVVFSGPVTVLTGARTFSAGEDFVAAFQTLARGRTIGSATGGSTGQPILVKLPGGGTGRICAKRDTFADGTSFVGKGLRPDVPVGPSLADFFAGRDVVLERAIAELSLSMQPKSTSAF